MKIRHFLVAIVTVLAGLVLWFYRDPERAIPADAGLVVSPADGLVTDVHRLVGCDFRIRISIRLSLLDVHVTRAPVSGRIAVIDYRRGRFGNAYRPTSSQENEQNRVRIEGEVGVVDLVQIAGMLARQIVFKPRLGDWVQRGDRVGMIRLGSRVDLYLPDGMTVLVSSGDRVRGGASIVARQEG